jgi:ATP-dependent exoDNAse (exonuclease V) alpha subunit
MSENPYRLARDIRGIGFKTADAIAMKLGAEKTAMIRVRAGISYALTEAMDEGHCGLPTVELTPLAERLLDVPQDLIHTALDLELADGTVIPDRLGETAEGKSPVSDRNRQRDRRTDSESPSCTLSPSPRLVPGSTQLYTLVTTNLSRRKYPTISRVCTTP